MERGVRKDLYEPAKLEMVLFEFSDVVTTSTIGGDEESNCDSGGWTS